MKKIQLSFSETWELNTFQNPYCLQFLEKLFCLNDMYEKSDWEEWNAESETEETGIQDMWRESCRYAFPLILLLLHFLNDRKR